jgi:hypothetical protein
LKRRRNYSPLGQFPCGTALRSHDAARVGYGPEEAMPKGLTSAALAIMLWCISPGLHAQAPPQEPVLTAPKLNLTLEQRHVIRELMKDTKPQSASGEFRAEAGDTVPQNVNLQPMPSDVAAKVPQVKTHRFFIAGEQIVIVDPKDNKVADVIKLGE